MDDTEQTFHNSYCNDAYAGQKPSSFEKYASWIQEEVPTEQAEEKPHLIRMLSSPNGNSNVSLVWYQSRLCVMKEYLHVNADWRIPREAATEIEFFRRRRKEDATTLSYVQCYGVEIDKNYTRILLEHIPYTYANIGRSPKLMGEKLVDDLMKLVKDLHSKKIAHRDIKVDNLMFRADGTLVLIDFDSAVFDTCEQCMDRPIGTEYARSPELFENMNKPYNAFALDWWSVGICALELLGDCRVAAGSDDVLCTLKRLFQGGVQALPKKIQACLTWDPAERITNVNALNL